MRLEDLRVLQVTGTSLRENPRDAMQVPVPKLTQEGEERILRRSRELS
jgi:hypothetical protein